MVFAPSTAQQTSKSPKSTEAPKIEKNWQLNPNSEKTQINLQVIYLIGTNKQEALISQQRMPRNILKRYMQMKTDLTHILHSQR